MSNKIYLIPDVHCRDFYKPILNIKDTPVIFLGDYMDPYSWERFDDEHGLDNLKEIIAYARENNNVTLLVGNHDCSWIWSRLGFERTYSTYWSELHELYRNNLDLFHACIKLNNTLFTHAGVSDGWINMMNNRFDYKKSSFRINQDNIVTYIDNEFANELMHDVAEGHGLHTYLNSGIFSIGYARWGDSPYGGPFWDDVHDEYKDPEGWTIKQIFSHTQLENTGTFVTKGNGTCIDSRSIFEYDLDTHELIKSSLNETN